MRMKALLIGDIRFQFKYGFYFLYLIYSVLYICLLFMLPSAWREKAAILMTFSDPAAMGLYFMGSIVLFERSEQVLNSIAISPVKSFEYVTAKLLSLAVISTAVAIVIGLSGKVASNIFYFTLGMSMGSCLFSAIGLMIAVNIATLNQFILATIPVELLIGIPAIAYLFGWQPGWLIFHPGVCIIELCQNGPAVLPATIILTLWTAMLALFASAAITKSFRVLGSVKL